MSTRSSITLKQEDGNFKSIYCHFDGYPTGVGELLYNYYNTEAKVTKLLNLGSISSLDETFGCIEAYHRDKGRSWEDNQYTIRNSFKEVCKLYDWSDYHYLFMNGDWYITSFPYDSTYPAAKVQLQFNGGIDLEGAIIVKLTEAIITNGLEYPPDYYRDAEEIITNDNISNYVSCIFCENIYKFKLNIVDDKYSVECLKCGGRGPSKDNVTDVINNWSM